MQNIEKTNAHSRPHFDHPLIIAAVVHYQLVTIHPFEDGNGRTAGLHTQNGEQNAII